MSLVRVVLDANVIISAAIRPSGPPGRIVEAFFSGNAFELVLSPAICAEVERVLKLRRVQKYLREPAATLSRLTDLMVLSDLVADTGRVRGVCRDPADDAVLATAVEGRAAAIVTGDDDLLALVEYEEIAIMTPRAFADLLDR